MQYKYAFLSTYHGDLSLDHSLSASGGFGGGGYPHPRVEFICNSHYVVLYFKLITNYT